MNDVIPFPPRAGDDPEVYYKSFIVGGIPIMITVHVTADRVDIQSLDLTDGSPCPLLYPEVPDDSTEDQPTDFGCIRLPGV